MNGWMFSAIVWALMIYISFRASSSVRNDIYMKITQNGNVEITINNNIIIL